MQELMAKGLTSDDINHGLRSVFGEDMRIAIPAADEEDEEVTVDTRFGVLHGLVWISCLLDAQVCKRNSSLHWPLLATHGIASMCAEVLIYGLQIRQIRGTTCWRERGKRT